MAPFYESVCLETGYTVDSDLLTQLKTANENKLAELEEKIEDSEKNFGETEQKEALCSPKLSTLCRTGNKVRHPLLLLIFNPPITCRRVQRGI